MCCGRAWSLLQPSGWENFGPRIVLVCNRARSLGEGRLTHVKGRSHASPVVPLGNQPSFRLRMSAVQMSGSWVGGQTKWHAYHVRKNALLMGAGQFPRRGTPTTFDVGLAHGPPIAGQSGPPYTGQRSPLSTCVEEAGSGCVAGHPESQAGVAGPI